jgi:hypothetical protein
MRHRPSAAVALLVSVTILAFVPSTRADAQGIQIGGDEISATLNGILSGTFFMQDALFLTGNGQRAEFVDQELDEWWHGGDVRNMRLTLRLNGPRVVGDWRANATFEMDFFAGFAGEGNFADEQPVPRLRLAYADLTNGRTTLRVGQDWALTLGQIPESVTHIGFPLGWGSGGFIGWRFPGVFLSQRLIDGRDGGGAELRLAAMQGSWSVEERGGGPARPDLPSAGQAGTPQLEARLNLNGRAGDASWNAYIAGHYDQKDLTGVTQAGEPEPADDDLTSWAGVIGGSIRADALTLQGNGYVGQAMGHHFAHVIQFGDFEGWGAWAQAGLQFAQNWSIWLYGGTDRPDEDDIRAAGQPRLGSWLLVPMLRFKAGPYAAGIEWLYNETDYVQGAGTETRAGQQVAFSVRFDF